MYDINILLWLSRNVGSQINGLKYSMGCKLMMKTKISPFTISLKL